MRHPSFPLALLIALAVVAGTSMAAKPEPVLRTVQDAVARLERDVLDTMRLRDELSAYLLRPDRATNDSIHLPPTLITSWEGDSVRVEVPSYVFLLDLAPTLLWTHPVVVVLVPAEVGTSARTTQHWISGPVLINGTLMNLGPMCGPNPDRVRGRAFNCTEVDTTALLPTARTDAIVFVVVGKHVGDADSIGFRHDAQSAALRLNWSIMGPQIHGDAIRIIDGADGKGASRQDLINTFTRPDGPQQQRYFITYIGHATQDGPMLSDGNASWSEFAEYTSLAPTGSAFVEFVTNYSGRIIPSLVQAGVRGSVLTATDTVHRTHYRTDGASDWHGALTTLFDADEFDVNEDKTIGQEEVIPFLTSELPSDDPVVLAKPMFRDLIDTMLREGRSTSASLNIIQPFQVTLRKSYVDGRSITSVYAVNARYFPIETHEPYEVVSQRDSAGRAVRTVIATVQPVIPMRSEIWLADLPDSCYGVAIRMVHTPPVYDTIVDLHYGSIAAPRETWYRTQHTLTGGGQDVAATTANEGSFAERMLLSPVRFTIPAQRAVNVTLSDRVTSKYLAPVGIAFSVTGSDRTRRMFRVRAHELTRPRSDTSVSYGSRLRIEATTGNLSIDSLQTSEVHLAPGRMVECTARSTWLHTVAMFAQPNTQTYWKIDGVGPNQRTVLNTINVNGLDSIVFATPTFSAYYFDVHRTPIIVHDLWSTSDLGFFSLYNSPSPAFRNVNIVGATDTVRIHDLVIIDADSIHMDLRTDGVIECTDCTIDLERCNIVGSGRLEQRQHISATVWSEAGTPIEGAIVHFIDRDGVTIATATTNVFGVANPDSLLIGSAHEGGWMVRTPIDVRYRDGAGFEHVQTAPHTRRFHAMFTDRTLSSINEPRAPYRQADMYIVPDPVRVGEDVQITSQKMIDQLDVFALDGARVASFTPQADRITIPTGGLFPGTYLCRARSSQATSFRLLHIAP